LIFINLILKLEKTFFVDLELKSISLTR